MHSDSAAREVGPNSHFVVAWSSDEFNRQHKGIAMELFSTPWWSALLARLDPAKVDARAKRRQAEVLAAAGGWDFAWKRGDLPFSPPPGVAASWS